MYQERNDKTARWRMLPAVAVFLLGAAGAGAQENLLYSTGFDGPDGSQPEDWSIFTPANGADLLNIQGGDYVADVRQGGTSATIVAQYRAPEAEEWSDYVVEATASYHIEPDSVSNRQVLFGVMGRASGTTTGFYTADFWVDQSWPAEEGPGGRFRLFRFGPNATLGQADNFLPRSAGEIPMPLEMTVTVRLSMIGTTIVATLLDDQGEILAQLTANDSTHTAGYPGIRPLLRDSIVRYHSYSVFAPGEPEVARDLRIHPALELSFPSEEERLYQVERQAGAETWEPVGERFPGTGETIRRFFSLREASDEDFRVVQSAGGSTDQPLLFETDFEGPDFTVPEGWDQRGGSDIFFALEGNQYVADFRFGSETFLGLSMVDGAEAAEWTDYMIEAEASYSAAASPVENWFARPIVVARAGPTTGAYYMAQFMPDADWADGAGGNFRIFRIGGGNAALATVTGFLTGDGPPLDMDMKIRFAVVGTTLTAILFDADGNELAKVSAEDSTHVKGTAGVRPNVRDAITRYDSFKVYDLTDIAIDTEVADLARLPASELSFIAPVGYSYQLEQSAALVTWADVGDPVAGSGDEVSALVPTAEEDRAFFRVMTLE